MAEGKTPTAGELASVLEANAEQPLPAWFVEMVVKSLRGELRRRPGRPKQSFLAEVSVAVAKGEYQRCLAWLQKREQSSGLRGWAAVRDKDWWAGPPHERAARIVTAKWLSHMSWRTFLNRVSSQ
jgi:hypothetical protein